MENSQTNQIWFITGVSSGFGKSIAKVAAQRGYKVYGSVRKDEQIEEFNNLVAGHTYGVKLDVTNHDQVHAAISHILDREGKIDVLINNAGFGLGGSVEEVSMDQIREQLETNFFGAVAVTKAVLPSMRTHKSGHIIQISSIAGFRSNPSFGIYSASKFALEGISEALYSEVKPFGVKVTIVEPGAFRTDFAGRSLKPVESKLDEYDSTVGEVGRRIQGMDGKQQGDPEKAAIAIVQIAEAQNPPLRLPLGKDSLSGIEAKIALIQKDVDEWRKLSENTAFDE
jgi:NAD(P)-dependent dehydrogenase (short-subunit alcohol dehydrogenase family)